MSSVKHKNRHSEHVRTKTVVGSSLTPCAAFLVHPSGAIHPIVDRHGFTWSDNAACESKPGHL